MRVKNLITTALSAVALTALPIGAQASDLSTSVALSHGEHVILPRLQALLHCAAAGGPCAAEAHRLISAAAMQRRAVASAVDWTERPCLLSAAVFASKAWHSYAGGAAFYLKGSDLAFRTSFGRGNVAMAQAVAAGRSCS